MIKVVSFDVWNTLLRIDVLYRELAEILHQRHGDKLGSSKSLLDRIGRVYVEAKKMRRLARFDESKIVEESCRMMARELGIRVEDLKKALIETFYTVSCNEILFDDVIETLQTLHSNGIEIAILGNTLFWPSALTRVLLHRCSIDKFVSVAMFSDEVGLCKPDRRIFIKLSEELGVEAEEVAHVGDGIVEDLGGALSAGMYGVLIDRYSGVLVVVKEARIAVVSSLTQVPEVLKKFV